MRTLMRSSQAAQAATRVEILIWYGRNRIGNDDETVATEAASEGRTATCITGTAPTAAIRTGSAAILNGSDVAGIRATTTATATATMRTVEVRTATTGTACGSDRRADCIAAAASGRPRCCSTSRTATTDTLLSR